MAGRLPQRSGKKSTPAKKGTFIGIVFSEWHSEIVNSLLESCYKELLKCGYTASEVRLHKVPGSFEIPIAAHWLLEKQSCLGVIALGCIIKGETQHDEFIAHAINHGLIQCALNHNKPVVNGILTTNNKKQAKARAGGKMGNKGKDCAYTLWSMLELKKQIL